MTKFNRINLEITNQCNLSCTFCPHASLHGNTGSNMSVEHFTHIARQAAPLCQQLTLHLLGEPLLHPQLKEILAVAHELQVPVEITTNGTLIATVGEHLLAAPALRQINFSLQSFFDNFPQASIDHYLSMLLHFVDQLRLASPHTYVNFRWWKGEDLDKLKLEQILCLLEKHYGVALSRNIDVAVIKSKKIVEKIYLHFDSPFEWPTLDKPIYQESGRCYALDTHIGIHVDGTVVPCCLDSEKIMSLGNCLQTPLAEILNSSRAVKIKSAFQQGELSEELCRHCDYIRRFQSKKKKHTKT